MLVAEECRGPIRMHLDPLDVLRDQRCARKQIFKCLYRGLRVAAGRVELEVGPKQLESCVRPRGTAAAGKGAEILPIKGPLRAGKTLCDGSCHCHAFLRAERSVEVQDRASIEGCTDA